MFREIHAEEADRLAAANQARQNQNTGGNNDVIMQDVNARAMERGNANNNHAPGVIDATAENGQIGPQASASNDLADGVAPMDLDHANDNHAADTEQARLAEEQRKENEPV